MCLYVAPGFAATPIGGSGEAGFSAILIDRYGPEASIGVPANIRVAWRLGVLMGEPTLLCNAQWAPSGNFGGVRACPSCIPVGGRGQPLSESGDAELLSVYDLHLTATINLRGTTLVNRGYQRTTVRVTCDSGIPGGPGKIPFNVTGSPEWNRLFCQHPSGCDRSKKPLEEDRQMRWLSEEEAKAIVREGFTLTDWRVTKVRMNAWDLYSKYERRASAQRLLDHRLRTLSEYADSIAQSQGWLESAQLVEPLRERIASSGSVADQLTTASQMVERLRSYRPSDISEQQQQQFHRSLRAADARAAQREEAITTNLIRIARTTEQGQASAAREMERYRQSLEQQRRASPDPGWVAFYEVVSGRRLYGFKDSFDQVVLPPRYFSASNYSEGLAVVRRREGGLYEYIDPAGNTVFGPYREAQPFNGSGGAVISLETDGIRQRRILQRDGRVLGPYDSVTGHINGAYIVSMLDDSRRTLIGVVDSSGTTIMPFRYQPISVSTGEDGQSYFVLQTNATVDGICNSRKVTRTTYNYNHLGHRISGPHTRTRSEPQLCLRRAQ